jgi:hypothetical protein
LLTINIFLDVHLDIVLEIKQYYNEQKYRHVLDTMRVVHSVYKLCGSSIFEQNTEEFSRQGNRHERKLHTDIHTYLPVTYLVTATSVYTRKTFK